jgi:hypothetical protein
MKHLNGGPKLAESCFLMIDLYIALIKRCGAQINSIGQWKKLVKCGKLQIFVPYTHAPHPVSGSGGQKDMVMSKAEEEERSPCTKECSSSAAEASIDVKGAGTWGNPPGF